LSLKLQAESRKPQATNYKRQAESLKFSVFQNEFLKRKASGVRLQAKNTMANPLSA
jgi:hypothetical protein